jgi:ATP-dependent helicase/nuclease subunit B
MLRVSGSQNKNVLMFNSSDQPRVYSVPIGADFSKAFIAGLFQRARNMPPQDFARTVIYVNTRRAARRIEDLFKQQGATLLPRLKVLPDLARDVFAPIDLPQPVSALARSLRLADLVAALIDLEPDLAPRSSVFALADTLAAMLDEMHGEGVSLDRLKDVEIGNASEHWARSLKFLNILTDYWASQDFIDTEARQRAVIEAYSEKWKTNPPDHPVIIAGSTGSRGATALFMQAVANLPQGAVVLPGFDTETPNEVWDVLISRASNDDHPQSMLARLMDKLGVDASMIQPWAQTSVFSKERNKILSLALRPAPVTDQWLDEGPGLISKIGNATEDVSMILANSPKEEAGAIAVCLREAASRNETAVLISPDRNLTRRVAAHLARWKIIPDDSAGEPLHLSSVGIFLRLTSGLIGKNLSPAALIAVLKHPMTHKADDRNNHLRLTRDLERAEINRDTPLIRGGPPFVDFQLLQNWAEAKSHDTQAWIKWMVNCFGDLTADVQRPMSDWISLHQILLFALSKGTAAKLHVLWDGIDGQEAQKVFESLRSEAIEPSMWSAFDYAALLYSQLKSAEVRDAITPHPNIAIWGTLEARAQGADLVILGGLNEGIWPQKPSPDPWLNRSMRKQLGLLLPERNIGLSAHDFQQAFAQKKVVVSRSIRDGEAPTVSSRWLTRLNNLLNGLGPEGEKALQAMSKRGDMWISLTRGMDRPQGKLAKAERPAPVPPKDAHPNRLSVTRIKILVRNPYEIYAQSILKLRPLKPYGLEPDALARGIFLHSIVEAYSASERVKSGDYNATHFLLLANEILEQQVPWSSARRLWFGRLVKIAPWFVEAEKQRAAQGVIIAQERKGKRKASEFDFILTAKADRLDRDASGNMMIYDYKSGNPPGKGEINLFDKQLQLEATIAQAGGFDGLDPMEVSKLQYISLKEPDKSYEVTLSDTLVEDTWEEFMCLLRCHFEGDIGYGARLKMKLDTYGSDYDQLSRFGEWEETDTPVKRDVP